MIVTARRSEGVAALDAPAASLSPLQASAPTQASLLPEPAAGAQGAAGQDGIQDAMSMMYELVAKEGNLQMATSEASVNTATRAEHNEATQQAAALKQEEAQEAKMAAGGGLFGEIGHLFCDVGKDLLEGNVAAAMVDPISDSVNIVDNPNFPQQLAAVAPEVAEYVGIAAALIGAAALTVGTGGAGGVVVAAVIIALSASGMFVSKTQCFGKDSAYIGLGLDIAATVVSCGAASGVAAGGALETASTIASTASGAAQIGAGVSTVVTGNEQADLTDDTADVEQATVALNRNARMVADLVAGMQEAGKSNRTALSVLATASQTYGQSLTTSSAKA